MASKKHRPERAWLTQRSRDLLEQAKEKSKVKAGTAEVVESALERLVDDMGDE